MFWAEKDVNQRLEEIMKRAFAEVYAIALKKKVSMRTAAYILGIGHVAEAKRVRGIFP